MRTRFLVLIVVGLLAVGAVPVGAHHAFAAEFDRTKPIEFDAVVTRMDWVNPHSWIHLDVKKPDGTIEKWMIESSTPNSLYRRGITQKDLAVGTELQITGFRAKDGSNRAAGSRIQLKSGRSLFLGSSGTGAPAEGAAGAKPQR